ncbi:MAG TPA: hypothetical protein VFF84_02830 [Sphingobium sp.]|nr:hypothetical protein [Sphingobium sp.]
MFIKTVAGPATVIAAALGAASGAIAQDSAVPVGPGSAATPASPAPTTNPAPGRSAPPPAQPGTTSIPPSDPAIAPQNGASDPGKAGERIGPPSDNVPPAGNPHDPADVQPDAKAGPSAGGDEGAAAAGQTTSSASPARPATSGSQVSAFVDAQFPTVDSDGDGALTPAEFEGWITKLKAAELEAAGQPADPQEVKSYARNALMNADKDGDQRITRAEATQFFSG